jgi:hypothetical protein
MNKKRKILTLVALAVFSMIILLHNVTHNDFLPMYNPYSWRWSNYRPPIPEVRMPLFALAVFYAGLFAILGDNKRKEQ